MSGRPKVNHRVNPGAIRTSLMAFALLALFLGSIAAHAQILYGSLTGTVTDKTGAVIPNATVTITNQGTGEVRTAKGNGVGEYSILDVLPGAYTLSIAKGETSPGSRKRTSRLKSTARCALT